MPTTQVVEGPSLPDRLVARSPRSSRRVVDAALVDAWCAEFASTRDAALRERIVAAHDWLVRLLARKMYRRDEPLDDLVQVASIGLLHAIDRFDPGFGVSFHTYASSTILGELRRHYRGTWRVRVPRCLQERHLAVNGAMEHLTAELRRTPTNEEVGAWLGLDARDVAEALTIGTPSWVTELTEPGFPSDDERPDDDHRLLARQLLDGLPQRERVILTSWLLDGESQQEVGSRFGMTQVQVSRSVRRSLRSMWTVAQEAAG